MTNGHQPSNSSRRDFLKTATAGAAGVAAGVAAAKSEAYSLLPGRVLGANEKIHIGHIGIGVQGGTHLRLLNENKSANNTESIALSDLYGRRLAEEGKKYDIKESMRFWDFRKLLENKDVDAVVVATSDNWHADVAIAAMQAGKHVYCEKPMCKTLEEAFKLYDTVKSTKRTFQLGSQGCSDPKYHNVAKAIKEGAIGALVVGQDAYMRNGKVGEWNNYGRFDEDAGPTAPGDRRVDWETFRKGHGPTAWDPDRFFRWRKYFSYGSGLVGDLFPHRLHPLMIAMGFASSTGLDGWPVRVSSGGGLYVQKINPKTGKVDREVPDFTNINVDMGNCTIMAMSSTINEQGWPPAIRGNKATLYFNGNTGEIKPERIWADEVEASTIELKGNGEPIQVHEKNWLDCIRDGKMPNCNIELATRVQVMITLGELSYRHNQTFTFDPKTRLSTPDSRKFNQF
jgi:predicted dehydrogenase